MCIPCEGRTFSTDLGVDPCRRCTQCYLLNRLVLTACSPTSDTVCGQCLPGLVPFTMPKWTPIIFFYIKLIGTSYVYICYFVQILWTEAHDRGSGAAVYSLFQPWFSSWGMFALYFSRLQNTYDPKIKHWHNTGNYEYLFVSVGYFMKLSFTLFDRDCRDVACWKLRRTCRKGYFKIHI